MNERIKKFALEAELITHKIPNGLAHLHTEKDLDKFAELIVQECITRAEREWIRNGDTEHNRAISKVIESIKHHLGVK